MEKKEREKEKENEKAREMQRRRRGMFTSATASHVSSRRSASKRTKSRGIVETVSLSEHVGYISIQLKRRSIEDRVRGKGGGEGGGDV